MKKQEGSFTVEASLIMPFICFFFMAVIYLMIFMHDRCLVQSYAIRSAEAAVWHSEATNMQEPELVMMTIDDNKCVLDTSLISKAVSLLDSTISADMDVTGHMSIGIISSRIFLGQTLNARTNVEIKRISYVDDWLKYSIYHSGE